MEVISFSHEIKQELGIPDVEKDPIRKSKNQEETISIRA